MIINYLGHMITQEEFVNGCYRYYAENYYEPGNPYDGTWEDCHYPEPKCLGGTTTVKLLKQHHAIQGVLQSEEYQHPCVWSWEKAYLEGDMLALYYKWKKAAGRNASVVYMANTTPEERSASARRRWAGYTLEERRARGWLGLASLTPEQRSAIARAREAALTPEQKSTRARKVQSSQTPEQRSKNAHRMRNMNTRRPVQVTYPDGRVGTYPDMSFTALALGLNRGNISSYVKYNKPLAKGIYTGYRFDVV